MPEQRAGWLSNVWQHLPAAIAEFPLLTAGEQTKLSWARRVETRNDAPSHFLETIDALVAETGSMPYLVLTPSFASFIVHTTEKLVCCLDDEIRIYERSDDEVRVISFYYADIKAVEFGCVLLKSWLKIIGTNTSGVETKITIKFNTVTDYLFLPVISKLRGVQQAVDYVGLEVEQAKFNYLAHDFYKFMNVAKKSLLPGEHVVGSLMQAELRDPFVTLFGHTYTRLKAPAHILVRTDRELIIAVEENQEAWSGSHKYGSIRTYIPLPKIDAITVCDEEDQYTHLAIHLAGGEQIELDFAAAHGPALRQLVPLPVA